jgi:hypothetical protein
MSVIASAIRPRMPVARMLRTVPTSPIATTGAQHTASYAITGTSPTLAPKMVMTPAAATPTTTGLNILSSQNIAMAEQVLFDVAGVIIVTSVVAAMAASVLPKSK